ncbi:nucleotide-binding universal stress UspA family protein [Natronocella acetinitrilica]|uniref:Nucleotide-binding universal stress UspA family protein n=1 Tax=Natronocella acetinitrilica TaxID=414046 RepID=A0AAE3G555_9GAMM|nr:universal stress protein [Natronocella acetinitrilica]MCP1675239.1 nucleotide-binding universal stress UspA family protein [Natronocella acetinitrilica]
MESPFRTIIVPVDGSRYAAAAVRYGGQLAHALKAPLQLVHVFPASPREMLERLANRAERIAVSYMKREQFNAMRDASAQRAFEAAREALPKGQASAEEIIVPGEPASGLIAHAQLNEAPLIIMGRRGLGSFRELLLGSVSERVVHHASCPVTLMSDKGPDALPSVLVVPVDGSTQGNRAAVHAASIARITGARIKLVHVYPRSSDEIPGIGAGMTGMAGIAPEMEKRFADMGREAARIAFEGARAAMNDKGLKIEEIRDGGSIHEAILDAAAEEKDTSAIVMGRRGLSRMKEMLLGSVSQRVLHRAKCPVTLVS